MFSLVKSLPYLIMASALAYGAHWFMINQLENNITDLESELAQVREENIGYRTAAQSCEQTVKDLRASVAAQQIEIGTLQSENQAVTRDRDSYLSVFKKRGRNFTRLARQRPGRIEPIINNGTSEVFDTIEQDTQHESTDDTVSPDTP